MRRILLIDADIIAYMSSASTQRTFDWGEDGGVVVEADFEKAKERAMQTIEDFVTTLKADDVVICLSDDIINFRKKIDPTYKSNRQSTDRPVFLYEMKDWLRDTYPSKMIPTLEADDVMGILATDPANTDELIIVSADKDMQTIPCLLYRPLKDGPKPKVVEITPDFADFYHMYQTLIGDATDGYPGCPGIGKVTAQAYLEERLKVVRTERALKSGKNKGSVKVTWEDAPSSSMWETVVSLYEKAGLKEADAIRQARLARILRFNEYNGRPVFWNPPSNYPNL